jgi:hypothetical protein
VDGDPVAVVLGESADGDHACAPWVVVGSS